VVGGGRRVLSSTRQASIFSCASAIDVNWWVFKAIHSRMVRRRRRGSSAPTNDRHDREHSLGSDGDRVYYASAAEPLIADID
jgi:hypothetical protein